MWLIKIYWFVLKCLWFHFPKKCLSSTDSPIKGVFNLKLWSPYTFEITQFNPPQKSFDVFLPHHLNFQIIFPGHAPIGTVREIVQIVLNVPVTLSFSSLSTAFSADISSCFMFSPTSCSSSSIFFRFLSANSALSKIDKDYWATQKSARFARRYPAIGGDKVLHSVKVSYR